MRNDSRVRASDLTRRAFLTTAGASAAAAALAASAPASGPAVERGASGTVADGPKIDGAVPVTLRINGKEHQLRIDPRTTLLDCLRETVALTGTKKGCDHGQCGACTVHVNGRRVNSCLSLALMHDGRRDHHHRRPRHARRAAPHAGGVRRLRRIPVRVLHVRPDHVGRRVAQGTVRSRRRGREGIDERQHLPLRRLSQHRGRDPASSQKRLAASRSDPHEDLRIHSARRCRGGGRDRRAGEDRAAGRGRAVPRRRDDADRPDEAERRNARAAARHQPPAARQDRGDCRTAG